MDEDMMISSSTSLDLQLCPVSMDGHEIFQNHADENIRPINTIISQQKNPRKKRTKMKRVEKMKAVGGGSGSHSTSKPKYSKKPDPNAPKITRPCSECGKRFWSWKALFGHMRCHPERPWRGINPPSDSYNAPTLLMAAEHVDSTYATAKEDRYMASCLLMLAKGTTLMGDYEEEYLGGCQGLFECISCNKLFGSHQALGGHMASHKNVKGCFAITRNDGGEEVDEREMKDHYDKICEGGGANSNMPMMMNVGSNSQHKCNICLRVFSSGQALGGHKRCHWEKEDDAIAPSAITSQIQFNLNSIYRLDLNVPAPLGEDYSRCSNVALDLRLGL